MQINKKLVLFILGLLIISLIAVLIFSKQDVRINGDYYYQFTYDDNKISQTVKVYNKKRKIQSNYYLFYNNEPISYTKKDKAIVTINNIDLKEHPNLQLVFEKDLDTKYKVVYKK